MSSNRAQILVDALKKIEQMSDPRSCEKGVVEMKKIATNALIEYNALEQKRGNFNSNKNIEAATELLASILVSATNKKEIIVLLNDFLEGVKLNWEASTHSTPDDVKDERKEAIEFANFVGDRALPEYSKSINQWRWWDNDKRDYLYATTEQLYLLFQNHITKK